MKKFSMKQCLLRGKTRLLLVLFSFLFLHVVMQSGFCAEPYRVLVVMSYEREYPWCLEIKEGINSVLQDRAGVTYFYMNTKVDLAGGTAKAKEAYQLYQDLNPHGVITVDDNAQSLFTVPYLKNKVPTPVMFCGVNAEPGEYGYPADNVSGILERAPIVNSINLARLLVPSIKTMSAIMKEGPSARFIHKQIEKEKHTYPLEFITFAMPGTLAETLAVVNELKEENDLLLMESLQGVTDKKGNPLAVEEVAPLVVKTFGKPVIGTDEYAVRYGALCAVVKTGQEQGRSSARMLLKAMQGTPMRNIPITRNREGRQLINVDVLKEMGIQPRPVFLQGVELVRTRK